MFDWKELLKQLKRKHNKKGGFLRMLTGAFGVILLGKLLTGRGILRAG